MTVGKCAPVGAPVIVTRPLIGLSSLAKPGADFNRDEPSGGTRFDAIDNHLPPKRSAAMTPPRIGR
jgi:hypothetical protein